MPPKRKVTKEEIVKTAVELVRERGAEAVNARAIATVLDCSTQPIFSNFRTMEELKEKTVAAAYEIYLRFLEGELGEGAYPPYKSFGMAYIRFAREEKELFRLLFMRDRSGEDLSPSPDFERSAEMIAEANGVTLEKARLMHLEMWSCVHGIGTMLATSFLLLDQALISDILSDVYQGIRARHGSEEKRDGSH